MSPRPLLITVGMGIGPEITARALTACPSERPRVLLGQTALLPHLPQISDLSEARPDQPAWLAMAPSDEPVPVQAIRQAALLCLSGEAAGMVTGPIHKKRLAERGFAYMGHTDFLGAICATEREPIMAFVGGDLRVALVTVHMPLMAVGAALSIERIAHTVRTTHRALVEDLGLLAPRLAVCGLNPHAGEEGLLGQEEITLIGPACAQLREEGLGVIGPVSAETAFLEARAGRVDLVVAMYHDQGLAPLKAVDFGRSVNWTLGLPILRTSVDHGTADALVGTGRADPASMIAALQLAEHIAARRDARE